MKKNTLLLFSTSLRKTPLEMSKKKPTKKEEASSSSSQCASKYPPFLSTAYDGFFLKIHSKPGAKKASIADFSETSESIGVHVDAQPVQGAANEALCEFIALTLNVKKRDVVLHSGSKSREKVLRVVNISGEDIVEKIRQGYIDFIAGKT